MRRPPSLMALDPTHLCPCFGPYHGVVADGIAIPFLSKKAQVSGIRRASAKKITAIIPFYSYRRNTQRVTSDNQASSYIFSSAADIAKVCTEPSRGLGLDD